VPGPRHAGAPTPAEPGAPAPGPADPAVDRRPADGAGFPEGRLLIGTAAERNLRWAAADLTPVVEEARARLDLSPLAAVALSRVAVGATLLQALGTRRVERLTVEVRGDGALAQVVAEVDADGNLRGTLSDPQVAAADGGLSLAGVIGRGRLSVLRESGGQLYRSQVELVSGELADDFTHYLDQSEQIDSLVVFAVLVRPYGVAAAGGLVVEVMPGADSALERSLELALQDVGTVLPVPGRLLEERGLEGLVDAVLAALAPEVVETRGLRYRCRCSRERLQAHLALLPAGDRQELADAAGLVSADCAFCGTTYRFSAGELAAAARTLAAARLLQELEESRGETSTEGS
jgi:molecular chaperone Hsp33